MKKGQAVERRVDASGRRHAQGRRMKRGECAWRDAVNGRRGDDARRDGTDGIEWRWRDAWEVRQGE